MGLAHPLSSIVETTILGTGPYSWSAAINATFQLPLQDPNVASGDLLDFVVLDDLDNPAMIEVNEKAAATTSQARNVVWSYHPVNGRTTDPIDWGAGGYGAGTKYIVYNPGAALMTRLARLFGEWEAKASAASVDLATVRSAFVEISGTTDVGSFGTVEGQGVKWIKAAAALPLTHGTDDGDVACPGGSSLTLVAGDLFAVKKDVGGPWRMVVLPPSLATGGTGAVLAKTASYGVTAANNRATIAADATSGALTLTLPAAASAGAGFRIDAIKVDAGADPVTVDGNGAETINGAATFVLARQFDRVALICDGTGWLVVGGDRGRFVKLTEGSLAGAAQVDFEWSNTPRLAKVFAVIQGAAPTSAGAQLFLRLKRSGAYDTAAAAYEFSGYTASATAVSAGGTTGSSVNTTFSGVGSTSAATGELVVLDPADTHSDGVKVTGNMKATNSSGSHLHGAFGATLTEAGAVTGLRLYWSAGTNFTDGYVEVYGVLA